jgi:hypothetical protein
MKEKAQGQSAERFTRIAKTAEVIVRLFKVEKKIFFADEKDTVPRKEQNKASDEDIEQPGDHNQQRE